MLLTVMADGEMRRLVPSASECLAVRPAAHLPLKYTHSNWARSAIAEPSMRRFLVYIVTPCVTR